MFYGLIHLPWWGYFLLAFGLTHLTAISITLFLHRSQAHRALELHPSVSHLFRFWLWLTTGMITKDWAAIHRKHHAKCETKEDPHSPQVLGIKKVLWEGAELYKKESLNKATLERYGQGTPDDWIERKLYSTHSAVGIFIMLAINVVLFGIPGITIWAIQMMWTPFFAAGIINGIGHYWGYRNFECRDASTNISPWGFFIAGEELHNNHHTFGTSAKFSVKSWEFDIGWMYICILSFFGLAKAKHVPPKLHINPNKKQVDLDTVKAVFSNRFQVMSKYSKLVIRPACKNANLARKRFIKKLMTRDNSLIKPTDKTWLMTVLKKEDKLNTIYEFRENLTAIWEKTTASQRELTESLQEWCKQAEATRIKLLEDFAASIRTYCVRPA